MRDSSSLIEEILKSISVDIFFPGRDPKEILEPLKTAFSVKQEYWQLKEDQQSENAFSIAMFPTARSAELKKEVSINVAIINTSDNKKVKISLLVNDKIERECGELLIRDLFKDVSGFRSNFKDAFDKAVDLAFPTKAEVEAEFRARQYAAGGLVAPTPGYYS